DERVRARRSPAMVAAGLEGDVACGAAGGRPSLSQRQDLGMRPTGPPMVPFSDDLPLMNDDSADHRVWGCFSVSPSGQAQGPPHPFLVSLGEGGGVETKGFRHSGPVSA